eukprot:TRINITY_DN4044_c0_g1_i1.p1 TRINITY_DN4044_c0_g1~~TRINITY_DN4044_c0_g1_i1.p1  ORF type:complete len:178 (+),score=12.33 TRINITY_DN4044_c0_g1_i1:50-535(+)
MIKPYILLLTLLCYASSGSCDEGGEDMSWWPDETGNHHRGRKGRNMHGFGRKEKEAVVKRTRQPREIVIVGESSFGPGDFLNLSTTYWRAVITLGVFTVFIIAGLTYKYLTTSDDGEEPQSAPVSPLPAPPQLKEAMVARLRSPIDAQSLPAKEPRFELLL